MVISLMILPNMGYFARSTPCSLSTIGLQDHTFFSTFHNSIWINPHSQNNPSFRCKKLVIYQRLVDCVIDGERKGNSVDTLKFKWVKISSDLMEEHKLAFSKIPAKMTNRCKALMKQIICFSSENGSISNMLAAWVKSMKPERADWLSVLKELDRLDHPLYFEVAGHALSEESFEANIRDYTKLIHGYAKQNRLKEAENALAAMKDNGFVCDQVTLTAVIHMYSKAGNLELVETTFEEMKQLGVPLDRRSYGAMIMAYIRAGMLSQGEILLREMEALDIYAGREVYKALLRAYSIIGDSQGAQRIFDATQLAGIVPDVKVCGLLINAYVVSGKNREARIAFENMRRAGLQPNDKCVALVLAAYENENRLKDALDLLIELEQNGVMLEREASELLAKWFRKVGIVEEVEDVLSDFVVKIPKPTT